MEIVPLDLLVLCKGPKGAEKLCHFLKTKVYFDYDMNVSLSYQTKLFLRFLGVENQAEIVEESIQHAKEAITLDVKDGNSWCKIFKSNHIVKL